MKNKEVETFSQKRQLTQKGLYITLSEKCNENCVFCVVKGGNENKFGDMSTREAKNIIKEFLNNGGKDIFFTGGEPTLRDDLPEIIRYAEKFNNLRSISVITNGVRLADNDYLKKLISADNKNLLSFSVSLHSHKEKISELLTDTKGTYRKTIAGINNVIMSGRRVSIYHVITSKNYRDLLRFVKFLNKRYPQIEDVTFAYPFPQGNALKNEWIYVKISLLRPYLVKALKFLESHNYRIYIASCGQFPLCTVPGFEEKVIRSLRESENNITGVVGKKAFHEFEMTSEEWVGQYKNKDRKCRKCILNNYCQGFWNKYIDLFGFDGIQPVTETNFKGNRVKQSLESEEDISEIMNKIIGWKMNLIILDKFSRKCLIKLVDSLERKKVLSVIIYKHKVLYPN